MARTPQKKVRREEGEEEGGDDDEDFDGEGGDEEIDGEEGVRFQSTPYPDVEQVVTGYDGNPNELYPTGQIDEPETDLDSAFWTPLLRACKCGKTQVMKHLLNAGANKNYESPCRANVISCLLDGIREDNDELAKNIALVATLQNINIREFMNDVLTDEELSELVVVNALLSNG
jgi:hypothetical protein